MLTTQNTKLWLPFEGDANDYSGNGLNGTANNITYAAGEVGRCAVFNGSTSYVSCPNIAMSTNMSFVVDLSLNVVNTAHYILSKRSSTANGFMLFYLSGSGFNFDFGGARFTTNYTVTANNRTQLIFARNASGTTLFINGKFISNGPAGNIYDNTENINVGKDALTASYFLNGKINFIQIYNTYINKDNAIRIYDGLHPLF